MPVTFGELTALAEDHLRFAARHDLGAATEPELVAVTCALAACTSRVSDLIATPKHRPRDTDPDPAWRLATATVADQLARARQLLARTTVGLSPRRQYFESPIVAHLLSGRVALGASRDLLATHIGVTTTGPVYRTPLATLIDSAPARRQLTVVTSTYASHLASIADQLAAQLTTIEREPASLILTAAGHLATANAATRLVNSRDAEQRALIGDLPAVEPLRRHPPQPGETPAQLLEQALASAQRLQLIAFRDLSSGVPSHHSAGTLAAVASAMVTSCKAQERLLDGLRTALQQAGGVDLASHFVVLDAEIAGTRSGAEAWSRIRYQWTEIRGLPAGSSDRGVRLDAADLAARLVSVADAYCERGLAAIDSPRVTTVASVTGASGRTCILEQHGTLRMRQQQIAAIHARLSQTLAAAGRLFVPTRSLPDENDVPRLWSRLHRQGTSGLAEAYGAALKPEPLSKLRESDHQVKQRDSGHLMEPRLNTHRGLDDMT
jgi:hypothetical protein